MKKQMYATTRRRRTIANIKWCPIDCQFLGIDDDTAMTKIRNRGRRRQPEVIEKKIAEYRSREVKKAKGKHDDRHPVVIYQQMPPNIGAPFPNTRSTTASHHDNTVFDERSVERQEGIAILDSHDNSHHLKGDGDHIWSTTRRGAQPNPSIPEHDEQDGRYWSEIASAHVNSMSMGNMLDATTSELPDMPYSVASDPSAMYTGHLLRRSNSKQKISRFDRVLGDTSHAVREPNCIDMTLGFASNPQSQMPFSSRHLDCPLPRSSLLPRSAVSAADNTSWQHERPRREPIEYRGSSATYSPHESQHFNLHDQVVTDQEAQNGPLETTLFGPAFNDTTLDSPLRNIFGLPDETVSKSSQPETGNRQAIRAVHVEPHQDTESALYDFIDPQLLCSEGSDLESYRDSRGGTLSSPTYVQSDMSSQIFNKHNMAPFRHIPGDIQSSPVDPDCLDERLGWLPLASAGYEPQKTPAFDASSLTHMQGAMNFRHNIQSFTSSGNDFCDETTLLDEPSATYVRRSGSSEPFHLYGKLHERVDGHDVDLQSFDVNHNDGGGVPKFVD